MVKWIGFQEHAVEPQGHARILGLVCFIALALPFLFGYGTAPLTNFAGEIVSAAGFAMLLLAATQYGDLGANGGRLSLVRTAFALLGLATIAQYYYFGGRNLVAWLVVLAYLAMGAVVVWVGHAAHASRNPEVWVRAVAGSLVVGSVLASCASIAQYFGVDGSVIVLSPSIDAGRTFGFIRQPNHQGTFLNLGLAGLYALHRLVGRRTGSLLMNFGSPLLVFGIISTGSRTALLQLIFLSTCAIVTNRRAQHGFRLILLPLMWAGFLWSVLFMFSQVGDTSFYGAQKLTQTASEGFGMRAEMWRQTLHLIFERPWFGSGPLYYTAAFFLSGAAEKVGLVMSHSHNFFLQLSYAYGIPIALSFCGIVATVLWQARKQFESVGGGFSYGLIACIGIHSLVEFPLWYVYFLLPACYCIGWLSFDLIENQNKIKESNKTSTKLINNWIRKKIPLGIGLSAISIVVWMNVDYYKLTPVYTSGLQITLDRRLKEANTVFWFRQFADFLDLHKQSVSKSNYAEYINKASILGCVMYEAWYQPKMIVALTYAGKVDEAKWILYLFGRLSNGKVDQFRKALTESEAPQAIEVLNYMESMEVVPKANSYYELQCYDDVRGN